MNRNHRQLSYAIKRRVVSHRKASEVSIAGSRPRPCNTLITPLDKTGSLKGNDFDFMEEVGRITETNASPGREALRLAELLITPFTFVASTCLQSGISLIKEDATPVEKGRCFHFLLAAAISVIGLTWFLIAIGENEQGNASEVKKLMISIWLIFFTSLSVMMQPLFFSVLYIVYDVSNTIATWSTVGASLLLVILVFVNSLKRLFQWIPLRGTMFVIIFLANAYGYSLYKK
ncbi:hypothetical protein SELMODRAFT_407385 [Selaginella moellendorffii]|uniref:Uncharacterized protein n=1 Tax=Selaginella moellendorffii TaxID=88036 RepID=D8R5F5_SELML|nr:hypothetical protein SELMODRAFT_407385 [Selaginella moellendorffii]